MTHQALPAAATSALETISARLLALGVAPADPAWFPGARRSAGLSDLLRALDGSRLPTGTARTDPWAQPTGQPDGAETWLTASATAADLGLRACRTARSLSGSPTAATDRSAMLATLRAASAPGAYREVVARWWGPRDPDRLSGWLVGSAPEQAAWLELTSVATLAGTDGPGAVVAVVGTWPVLGSQHLGDQPTPGRDGTLVVAPAQGSSGPELDGVVHLLGGSRRDDLDVLTRELRDCALRTFTLRSALDTLT